MAAVAMRDEAVGEAQGQAEAEADFFVLDVETANRHRHSVCQIGFVRVTARGIEEPTSILVDPQGPFEFTRIHGIAAHHVRGQPAFDGVHARLRRRLGGRVVVAHSNFDRAALAGACARHDLPDLGCRWVDSIRVARAAWPGLPSYALKALADRHGIAFRHHDGLEDATATAHLVIRALAETGRGIGHWVRDR